MVSAVRCTGFHVWVIGQPTGYNSEMWHPTNYFQRPCKILGQCQFHSKHLGIYITKSIIKIRWPHTSQPSWHLSREETAIQLHFSQANEAAFALVAVWNLRDIGKGGSAAQVVACLWGLKHKQKKVQVGPAHSTKSMLVFSKVIYTRVVLRPHQQNKNSFLSTSSTARSSVKEACTSMKSPTEIQGRCRSFEKVTLELPTARIRRRTTHLVTHHFRNNHNAGLSQWEGCAHHDTKLIHKSCLTWVNRLKKKVCATCPQA